MYEKLNFFLYFTVSSYKSESGFALKQGHVEAHLGNYGPEFDILLKFKINSFNILEDENSVTHSSSHWRSIFHVSRGGDNDRFPALFLDTSTEKLGIWSDGVERKLIDNVQFDQYYTFNIRQKQVGNSLKFQIWVNNVEVYNVDGHDQTFEATKLYLSDAFYPKADITLEYFILEKKFGKSLS